MQLLLGYNYYVPRIFAICVEQFVDRQIATNMYYRFGGHCVKHAVCIDHAQRVQVSLTDGRQSLLVQRLWDQYFVYLLAIASLYIYTHAVIKAKYSHYEFHDRNG